MDWLIKMEMAKANIARAIAELADVEGMEYLQDRLKANYDILAQEIDEYRQHSGFEIEE